MASLLKIKYDAIKEEMGLNFDFKINNVSSIDDLDENCISFYLGEELQVINRINHVKNSIIFVKEGVPVKNNDSVIIFCKNPRLEYIKFATKYCTLENSPYNNIDDANFVIHPSSKIGNDCNIASNVIIGPGCVIGDKVTILPNTVLVENVTVENNVVIGANCVIGGWGFGVERDNQASRTAVPFNGNPIKMPHFGGVVIRSFCNIGSLNTIVAGAMNPTLLEEFVQTDDHVHIAHNCKVGKGTLITAHAEISGSVVLGEEVWIGPNSSIIQKINIGDRTTIGINSNVRKSTENGSVYAGNPAKRLK